MPDHIYGEGSWSVQKKGGSVYQRYVVTINGKRKDFYGKTKADCLRKYKDFLQNNTPDEFKKTPMTVSEVATRAIESRRGQIKPTTYDFYLYAIKRLNKGKIGALQIHSVTLYDVQEYINSLADKCSLSTIKSQRVILTIAYSYAEDNGLVEKNFMSKVRLPNEANIVKEAKEPVFLTTDERKLLESEANRLNTNKSHNGRVGAPTYGITAKAIVFLLHTGLRMGELIGLLWEDVDMDKRFLHIKHNVPTTRNEITTPKRKSSIRTIPLDGVAYDIISELSDNKNGRHVFHTKSGNMINRNDTDRTLKTMLKRAGIEKKPTLHDLRHTYASELIRNGVDMKTVSVVLGHSDISTTMNIYVHKSDDDLEKLKNVLK